MTVAVSQPFCCRSSMHRVSRACARRRVVFCRVLSDLPPTHACVGMCISVDFCSSVPARAHAGGCLDMSGFVIAPSCARARRVLVFPRVSSWLRNHGAWHIVTWRGVKHADVPNVLAPSSAETPCAHARGKHPGLFWIVRREGQWSSTGLPSRRMVACPSMASTSSAASNLIASCLVFACSGHS